MKPLSKKRVALIRKLKNQGVSLNGIVAQVGCSKATASFYTRDLFTHPARKYHTIEEMRERRRFLHRNKPHKRQPSNHRHRKLYPCASCKTTLIYKKGGICIKCYTTQRREQSSIRATAIVAERAKRQEEKEGYQKEKATRKQRYRRSATVEICPKSPTKRHRWMLDKNDYGICKDCKKERDFRELQEKEMGKSSRKRSSHIAEMTALNKPKSTAKISSKSRGQPPKFSPQGSFGENAKPMDTILKIPKG